MIDLITIYYDLSKIFNDDIECVADAIRDLGGCNKSRYATILSLRYLRLKKFDKELNFLYDMKMDDLRAYYAKWIEKHKGEE